MVAVRSLPQVRLATFCFSAGQNWKNDMVLAPLPVDMT